MILGYELVKAGVFVPELFVSPVSIKQNDINLPFFFVYKKQFGEFSCKPLEVVVAIIEGSSLCIRRYVQPAVGERLMIDQVRRVGYQ